MSKHLNKIQNLNIIRLDLYIKIAYFFTFKEKK